MTTAEVPYISYVHPNTHDNVHTRAYQRQHRDDAVRKCAGCYIICDSVQCEDCGMKYCSKECRIECADTHADVCKIRSGVYKLRPKPAAFSIAMNSHTVNTTSATANAMLFNAMSSNRAFLTACAAVHGKFETRGLGCGCLVVVAQAHMDTDKSTNPLSRTYFHGTFVYMESANGKPFADATPNRDTTVITLLRNGQKTSKQAMISPEDSLDSYTTMVERGIDLNIFFSGEPMGFVCDDGNYMEFCDPRDTVSRVLAVKQEKCKCA